MERAAVCSLSPRLGQAPGIVLKQVPLGAAVYAQTGVLMPQNQSIVAAEFSALLQQPLKIRPAGGSIHKFLTESIGKMNQGAVTDPRKVLTPVLRKVHIPPHFSTKPCETFLPAPGQWPKAQVRDHGRCLRQPKLQTVIFQLFPVGDPAQIRVFAHVPGQIGCRYRKIDSKAGAVPAFKAIRREAEALQLPCDASLSGYGVSHP